MNIGLQHVQISLRGFGGEAPTGTAFFEMLRLKPDDTCSVSPSESPWQAATIRLFSVSQETLQSHPEPEEEFAAEIRRGFHKAAEWLRLREPTDLDRWRASGKKADVFIGGWLANEQFDLRLPSEFLLECGRLGLPIEICTND
jgi:hypothetical protein